MEDPSLWVPPNLSRSAADTHRGMPSHSPLKPTKMTSKQNSHHGTFLAPSLGLSSPAAVCLLFQALFIHCVHVQCFSGDAFCQININYNRDVHNRQTRFYSFCGSQPRCRYPDGVIPTGGCLNVSHAASVSA